MKKLVYVVLCLVFGAAFVFGSATHAWADGESYIDQLAQQIADDIESGEIKNKVQEVKTEPVPSSSPIPSDAPGLMHFTAFFAAALGPQEFSDPSWLPPERTGSFIFGDSIIDPTGIRIGGPGIIGADIDEAARTMTIDDANLRNAVNSGDTSNINSDLENLGFLGGHVLEW